MPLPLHVGDREIGPGQPCWIVAEMSANHNGSLARAEEIVRAAADSGADAIKLQTYTADTMTLPSSRPEFMISGGTLWDGRSLYELYEEAFTPWEWQPRLKQLAEDLGLACFSSPFDVTSVDFLVDELDVGVLKLASFEIDDLPLLRKMASTGLPLIASSGLATLAELDQATRTWRAHSDAPLALLKCTSAYPAPPEDANLRTIPHMARAFDVVTGLSDHTLGVAVAVTSVAMGGSIIEKHFTLSRDDPGPDSTFSLEPHELRRLVDEVRIAEKALGSVQYGLANSVRATGTHRYRRSVFASRPIAQGEVFTPENVRVVRPSNGLSPKHYDTVLGQKAAEHIEMGTPLSWRLVKR